MNNPESIEIRLSKKKLVILLTGALAFVALGAWLLVIANNPRGDLPFTFSNPALLRTIGDAAIIFFGLCAFYIANKLRDKTPGLIISEKGIFDNSSGVSAGLIPWQDIIEIRQSEMMGQKLLILFLRNPAEYISRQTSLLKRKGMEMNFKTYGSPIFISANGLQCNFNELMQLVETKFREYKS